ncbi:MULTISPECIES: WD40 repeat domain-containing protein [Trichocoleus]|uniref:WD40 repeat domain-containing protein n=1 Tax=Trichocoleus desertorum GB2-A4 TaxID=2933944 RepID=A0ABV0J467_9CYAN|nr:WD40 repeat domain-containing protein [Trichocoleus sp. FACHB-46]MBD1861910.1 WD40 repeat domain-containing protein [Trichocoleus sp. FACHB-46]
MTGKQISQKSGLVDLTAWTASKLKSGMTQAVLDALKGNGSVVGNQVGSAWQQAQLQSTFSVYPALVSSVAFSADGQTLICGHSAWGGQPGHTIKVWHRQTRKLLNSFPSHIGSVSSIAVSSIAINAKLASIGTAPDDQLETAQEVHPYLVSSSADEDAIKVWDLRTRTLLHTLRDHTAGVKTVAIAPDGQIAASGSYDNSVKLWDLSTGTWQQTFLGHTDTVSGVAFDPQGQVLASCSYDQTIKLWDLKTGELSSTLVGHSHRVTSLAFSPDGSILASASEDKTIRLWNWASGELQIILNGHAGDVLSVAFSPDGQTVASGSADETVKLWCPLTGRLLRTFGKSWSRLLPGHAKWVSTVSFSLDGCSLASGCTDGSIKIWSCTK